MAMPATHLWLDPSFGASGDMLLGALVGLASNGDAQVRAIAEYLDHLPVDGWSIELSKVQRSSIQATRVAVTAPVNHHHRSWSSIDAMLAGSDLPEQVRSGARQTFRRLGEVEAGIHGVSIDEVHFHEVGAVDAIVDIVGVWLAWWLLNPDTSSPSVEVVCGPVGLGSGTIDAAHGRLPLPAPATAELLLGAPVKPVPGDGETVTPTGAALLATLANRWDILPAGTMLALARGAGGRDPSTHPNVVSAYLLACSTTGRVDRLTDEPKPDGLTIEQPFELTTNVDDITPELAAYVIDAALAAGADDAWSMPITMKKGRSAMALTVLCRPEKVNAIQQLLLQETGSLGLRIRPVEKRSLGRSVQSVTVDGHPVRVKVGPHRAKPEYDDVAAAARALGRPFREVAAEAWATSTDPLHGQSD